jgi:hypothetical protein
MNIQSEREMLNRIEQVPEPRHFFIPPVWVDLGMLTELIDSGYLICTHQQRDGSGRISVVMGMEITPKGKRLVHPRWDWQLALKGSLAGASFAGMSVVILYLG